MGKGLSNILPIKIQDGANSPNLSAGTATLKTQSITEED